jgi:hypothetical protein
MAIVIRVCEDTAVDQAGQSGTGVKPVDRLAEVAKDEKGPRARLGRNDLVPLAAQPLREGLPNDRVEFVVA